GAPGVPRRPHGPRRPATCQGCPRITPRTGPLAAKRSRTGHELDKAGPRAALTRAVAGRCRPARRETGVIVGEVVSATQLEALGAMRPADRSVPAGQPGEPGSGHGDGTRQGAKHDYRPGGVMPRR